MTSARRGPPLQAYLAALVVVFIAASVIALVYDRSRSTHDALAVTQERLDFVAALAAKDLDDTVGAATASAAGLAANTSIPGLFAPGPPPPCQLSFDLPGHLDVVAADGSVRCSSDPLPEPGVYAGAPWLQPDASGAIVVGPVLDAATGRQVVVVASPVPGQGGVVAELIELAAAAESLASRFSGPLRAVFTIDAGDRTIAGDPVGDDAVSGTDEVPSLGWTVTASIDPSLATADVDDRFRHELVLVGSAAIVVLIATLLVYRGLARPIERLSASVRAAMGSGRPPAIEPSGPREVVSLAEDFSTLARDVADVGDRYRLLFDRNPQPMWVQDRATGGLLEVNDAMVERFGWSRDELLTMRVGDLVATDQAAMLDELAGSDRVVRSGPWRLVDSAGETVECELTSDVLELPGRAGRLVIAEDVTAHLRTQRLLHRSERMESLGQLAGGIAHDFNNLLAVIINYADFAAEEAEAAAATAPEQWQHVVDDIQHAGEAARRAAVLTHQLLDFARGEPVAAVAVDLGSVVLGLEPLLRRTIGEHIALDLDTGSDLWSIEADPGQLEQVVVNLAINARDSMPSGGSLTIEVCNLDVDEHRAEGRPELRTGRYVRLRVSDTGTGMDERVRDHVFEPFFTTKERGSGTGLGLATVYGVVQRARGVINVYSELGLGTTFTVLFPATASATGTEAAVAATERRPAGTETVLVVDDDADLRTVAERILRGAGFRVLTAVDGESALLAAARHRDELDLVVTDVVMPGMLGSELVQELRAAQPGLRILLMSGYAPPVLVAGGSMPPGTALLDKPFSAASLVAKVREVLDAPA